MTSLRPTCARCHKLVDSFEEQPDAFMDRVTFVARCHGQTERIMFLHPNLCGLSIQGFGLAFVPAKELTP